MRDSCPRLLTPIEPHPLNLTPSRYQRLHEEDKQRFTEERDAASELNDDGLVDDDAAGSAVPSLVADHLGVTLGHAPQLPSSDDTDPFAFFSTV